MLQKKELKSGRVKWRSYDCTNTTALLTLSTPKALFITQGCSACSGDKLRVNSLHGKETGEFSRWAKRKQELFHEVEKDVA